MIKSTNKRIAITLTEQELKKIEKLANTKGVSKSIIIKLAIDAFVNATK